MEKSKLNTFPNYIPTKKELLKASLLIIGILFFQFFNTFKNFNSHFLGGAERDAGLYIWLTEISFKSLFKDGFFNTNAFYPYTRSLAWSDNYIFPSFLNFLFVGLGLSKVASYNLIIFLAKFFQGYFFFKLSFLLRGNFLSSLVATSLFVSLSYVTSQIGHPQMQWLVFISAPFYFYFKYLATNSKLSASFLGTSLFLSFLTSVYISFYAFYFLLFLSALLLILKGDKKLFFKFLTLFTYSIPFILLLIPFILPYLDIKDTFGGKHLYEAKAFSLNIFDYFKVNNYNFLYSLFLDGKNQEKTVFSGFIILFGLIYSFFTHFKKSPLKKLFLIGSLLFTSIFILEASKVSEIYHLAPLWLILLIFIFSIFKLKKTDKFLNYNFFTNDNLLLIFIFLSFIAFSYTLGPVAHIDDSIYPLSLYSISYHFLPGFSALRASSRFVIIVYFFLSLILVFILPKLLNKTKYKKLISFIIIVVIFLENFNFKYPLEELKAKPKIINSISLQKEEALLVLPFTKKGVKKRAPKSFGDYAFYNVNYMNWLSNTDYQLLNGYSGQRSRIINTYPYRLKDFPSIESLNAINEVVNLNTILVLKDFINNENDFLDKLKKFSDQIKIEKYEAGNFLLKIKNKVIIKDKKDFKLRIKSYPQGGRLEFLLDNLSNAENLNVYVEPYNLDKPILSFKLNKDLKQKISFRVPNTIDKVRPRLLRFEANNKKELLILDIKYSSNND